MKIKPILLSCILLLVFPVFIFATGSPSKKGFKKLNSIYTSATRILDISTVEQMPAAIDKLNKLQNRYDGDQSVKEVLLLTPETCPAKWEADYRDALQLQSDLKDAGKRLAMGGILTGGGNGAAFKSFMDAFKLTDNAEKEPLGYEGAPRETVEQRDARMKWWRDGKFGMFIHYGLYSGLGGRVQGKDYEGCVEWIQMQSGLDSETYAAEALPLFKPKTGNAEEWVKLAKEAGCTYTVLTSRHHEGFNMFDTRDSDFNVKKLTGIDVIDEYSKACEKHDMKAGYYVSLLDWSHPDYDPTGSGISYPAGNYKMQEQGKRQFGNHEKYKEYLFNIVDDLSSKYRVDLVWWDFSQPKFQGDAAWGATRLMKMLFEKNPNMIQNNRLYHSDNHLSEGGIKVTPTWKGDYSTAEHHIPATGIDGDWEACQTLNGTWGYSSLNNKWRTSDELIRELIDVVSRGGNFLLNIGPDAEGGIPEESIRIFKEIGSWMNVNGQAIYETRANPFPVELTWGRVTRKGDDEIYLLVYEKPESGVIGLPCLFEGGATATLLDGGKTVTLNQDQTANTTTFDLSGMDMNPAATVIKVKGLRK